MITVGLTVPEIQILKFGEKTLIKLENSPVVDFANLHHNRAPIQQIFYFFVSDSD